MEIRKLIRQEIEFQKFKTQTIKLYGNDLVFPDRVNIKLEEDRLRNMLIAEQIVLQLAEKSINTRNHLIFHDFKRLFPETYNFCKHQVTHQ